MTTQEREKLIFELAHKGEWDKAIEHAKRIPSNHDIWQRLPTANEDGMPDQAINKILDHFDNHDITNSGFLFEMSSNLLGHNQAPTLNRLADYAHNKMGGSYYELNHIINHPNYKPKEEDIPHIIAHNFWNSYEKKVEPSHFAAVKSLFSGKPEQVVHRNTIGTSENHDTVIPHLRDYANKVQDKILSDDNLYKRKYNGENYIKVHRGVGGHYAKAIRDAAKYNNTTGEYAHKNLIIPVTPFSSWTTDKDMAQAFATGRGQDLNLENHGLVMSKWMPVKNILYSGQHGFIPGRDSMHPSENEIVFSHPTGKLKVNTGEFDFENPEVAQYYGTGSNFHKGIKAEKITKSIKNTGIAFATAAAMMGVPQQLAQPEHIQSQFTFEKPNQITPLPGLKYIEMIESSGNKNLNHKVVNHGLNSGTKAIGKYGIMPLQVIDTIKNDKNLSHKYPEFLHYDHLKDQDKIRQAVSKNHNFENELANSHWKRLYDRFDGNEAKMAHAWINGITGTARTPSADINNHDYVKKYKKYKKLMQLEHKPQFMKKNENELPSEVQNIKEFLYFGSKDPASLDKVNEINRLISNRAMHKVPSLGEFTSSSFILGTDKNNSWLMKIESGNRPAIMSAKSGLQAVKEVAFYEAAKDIFGLQEIVPDSLLGEVEFKNEKKPAAAIKILPEKFKLAVDKETDMPGSMFGILEKYRKSGALHKMAAMLYILGDGDSHGRNVMTDGYFIKLIDHGSAFGDEKFDPISDNNIFTPYIMRVGRIKDSMSNEEKLEKLPKIDSLAQKNELKYWLLSLDSNKLGQKLNNYNIDPKPSVDRLKKLQIKVSQGAEPDTTINEAWVGTGEKNVDH